MTISEIAKLAGVSNAAVSRYLNNGYLSDDKKAAIKKVIEETGYQPSLQAQILRTHKTKLCGVIFQNVAEYDYGFLINGIADVLDEKGYGLLFARADNTDDDLISAAQDMKKRLVDSLMILSENISREAEDALHGLGLPLMVAGSKCESLHSVYYDQTGAIKEITGLLLRHGKSRPAFVGLSPKYKQQGAGRFDGFRAAINASNVQLDTKVIVLCDSHTDNGYQAAKALLERVPGIDAVCCATDELAVGALRYLKDADRTDVMVTGCGNSPILQSADRPLLSADTNLKVLAVNATEFLCDVLEKKDAGDQNADTPTPIQKRLPAKLINITEAFS